MACLNYPVVTCSAVFKTIFITFVISLLWLGCMNTSHAQTNHIQSKSSKGELVEINGQKIYYERYGNGKPLVLLHGGINSIQSSFKNQI